MRKGTRGLLVLAVACLMAGMPAARAFADDESGATSGLFTRDLTLGSTGRDVAALQAFLNANGFTVASNGPGSGGHESMTFGPLTKAALARFQKADGISPAAGYFGPITRKTISPASNGN